MQLSDPDFRRVVQATAQTLVSGEWSRRNMLLRLVDLVSFRQSWMIPLVEDVATEFATKPLLPVLIALLSVNREFLAAYRESRHLRNCKPAYERTAAVVAEALVVIDWDADSIQAGLAKLVGSKQAWMPKLAESIVQQFQTKPDASELGLAIANDHDFQAAHLRSKRLSSLKRATASATMQPAFGAPQEWLVPELVDLLELAQWLEISPSRLHWCSDPSNEFRRDERARHYRYRWSRKRRGGFRLIEAPKAMLKQIQRDISDGILARIPTHEAVHGFCRGRNIRSFTQPHTGQHFVMRMDLRDFFTSINRKRVNAIFRSAGYPAAVAWALSGLVTVRTPTHVLNAIPDETSSLDAGIYSVPHLPQGAPSSPALANLSAFPMDCRLAGLATQFGAVYTRYADDLLFSGGPEFAKDAKRFHVFALAIVLDEGFQIHPRKTRMMRRGVCQQAAGLVLNDKVNTHRRDYERLKAILHNCVKFGPDSQNHDGHEHFRHHLQGRVNFHVQMNPVRGRKLQDAFAKAFPDPSEVE